MENSESTEKRSAGSKRSVQVIGEITANNNLRVGREQWEQRFDDRGVNSQEKVMPV